jgi:hypothetical protein
MKKLEANQFERSEELEGLPGRLVFQAVRHDWEGYRILVRPNDPTAQMIRLKSRNPLSYRVVHRSMWPQTKEFEKLIEWPLYTVKNSDYLEWFHFHSLDIHRNDKRWPITHYTLFTQSHLVDMLSVEPPAMEIL